MKRLLYGLQARVAASCMASSSNAVARALMLQHSLTALFKARKHMLPAVPATLAALLQSADGGIATILGRPGAREALLELYARVFQIAGREAEGHELWEESVAAAVFAARLAQLLQAPIAAAFGGGLLHRTGEALALRMLARVELDYRMQLDAVGRRDWCATRGPELAQLLVRGWDVPATAATCALGWRQFGEFASLSGECSALYFGRLLATELLTPGRCVPGAIEQTAAELGLADSALAATRAEGPRARELVRVVQLPQALTAPV